MKPFLKSVTNLTATLIAVVVFSSFATAQSSTSTHSTEKLSKINSGKVHLKTTSSSNVNVITDVQSFRFWLNGNLKKQLGELNIKGSGEMIVGFAVDEKGNLTNIKIVDSSNPAINETVLKLLCDAPKWSIKQSESHPYKIYYSVPIKYDVR